MAKRNKKSATEAVIETPVLAEEFAPDPYGPANPNVEYHTLSDEEVAADTPTDEVKRIIVESLTQASIEEIAAVLATVDANMENAVTAGPVDHSSQLSSWTSEDAASEALLADTVEALEAERCEETIPFPEPEDGAIVEEQPQRATLAQLTAGLPDEAVDTMVVRIAREVDARSAFETEQDPDNANIHRTLKKVRTQLVTKRAAKLLLATHVDPAFINRTVHTGSAYNVYALGKLSDIIYGVTDGVVANAINVACMKSLFAFKRAGAIFTMECAKAAASKQYARNIDAAVRKHLISHTVSTSTAPTQASSTMQALVTLGVVKTNGAGKNPTYEVLDTPIAHKLEAMLLAA